MTGVPVTRFAVRQGAYHDSVVLMGLQAALAGLPEVLEAGVVMATPANRELLAARGLLPAGAAATAGPADLLVVVRAASEGAAGAALARVDEQLAGRRAAAGLGFRPRSLAGAVRQLPEASWVMVSVPGRYAAGVAREALDLGRHVFLYSDNVSLADEAALKRTARNKGLLVLGPDCGTAILGGVGMGFANRVRRGAVGLVGASGTGLQAVTCEIHRLGAGISHALGTGGRDLAAEVGGATAGPALDLLRRDPGTEVIVLVAKPPAPAVATRLLAQAGQAGKPVVVDFLGADPPAPQLGNLHFAASFAATAAAAVALLAGGRPRSRGETGETGPPAAAPSPAGEEPAPRWAPGQRFLRGLFSGGSLAAEAMQGLRALPGPVFANFSAAAAQPLRDPRHGLLEGHALIDLGADELTVGRPHPMIDHHLLLERLAQEANDPAVAMILLDVVLGDGAHPDPAGDLAPAIAGARARAAAAGRRLEMVAIVVGTDKDPQGLAGQMAALAAAGARVCRTVGEAVEHARRSLPGQTVATAAPASRAAAASPAAAGTSPGGSEGEAQTVYVEAEAAAPPVPLAAVEGPIAVINVGLESFHTSLIAQGIAALHVDWRPPAGGDEKLAGRLERMRRVR
ncbi:MAG TPA: acyl-CoA synthetase FdrA [Thermoanaerobaculia bacterium]|nr:acyl-CoA synthetase FdrA [Thermoanaerobaculia bacterium]